MTPLIELIRGIANVGVKADILAPVFRVVDSAAQINRRITTKEDSGLIGSQTAPGQ